MMPWNLIRSTERAEPEDVPRPCACGVVVLAIVDALAAVVFVFLGLIWSLSAGHFGLFLVALGLALVAITIAGYAIATCGLARPGAGGPGD